MAARAGGKIVGWGKKPWWTVPENFLSPLVFYMDEALEECIFGPSDADLRSLEEHSRTLIQLERWFTASGLTRVMVVGPTRARQRLLLRVLRVGHWHFEFKAQGLEKLKRFWSQPQTDANMNSFSILQPHDLMGEAASLVGPEGIPLSDECFFQAS